MSCEFWFKKSCELEDPLWRNSFCRYCGWSQGFLFLWLNVFTCILNYILFHTKIKKTSLNIFKLKGSMVTWFPAECLARCLRKWRSTRLCVWRAAGFCFLCLAQLGFWCQTSSFPAEPDHVYQNPWPADRRHQQPPRTHPEVRSSDPAWWIRRRLFRSAWTPGPADSRPNYRERELQSRSWL